MLLRRLLSAAGRPGLGFHTSAGPLLQADAAGGAQMEVFDGPLKALHRDRAARSPLQPDPLVDEVADRLLDRLEDCRRSFERAVILGGAGAKVAERLAGGRAGIKEVVHVDTSQGQLDRARSLASSGSSSASSNSSGSGRQYPPTRYVHWDPSSEILPLEPGEADLVISCLGLHWVNDVPGVMAQCRHALRPDGLFLAAMFGGNTLQEMRIACTIAQQEREGGVSARVSPLAQVRDAGNLLTRAGLGIPAVDVDDIQVHYSDAVQLVQHLRSMGESNGLIKRRQELPRSVALASAAAYAALFAEEDGSIPATYQVIYMTGWAPHPSHQQPAKRGSATVSFEDLVKDLGGEQGAEGGEGSSSSSSSSDSASPGSGSRAGGSGDGSSQPQPAS